MTFILKSTLESNPSFAVDSAESFYQAGDERQVSSTKVHAGAREKILRDAKESSVLNSYLRTFFASSRLKSPKVPWQCDTQGAWHSEQAGPKHYSTWTNVDYFLSEIFLIRKARLERRRQPISVDSVRNTGEVDAPPSHDFLRVIRARDINCRLLIKRVLCVSGRLDLRNAGGRQLSWRQFEERPAIWVTWFTDRRRGQIETWGNFFSSVQYL
ncbi:hypothetical protein RRG08_035749 [Elysia crispata]|uniref:Uncharacterized protein n=1 Tax=Elysia crispata TaxID=231223 RepID=A0AAE0ZM00_9GAST|nr:hypothetical protein RRG08_035749 [Elysia crispata]